MTTSTASEVPFSVERGVSTRVIWMSRVEPLLADADGEDRNRPRLQARERLVERCVRGVGAVGDHHQPGERQPGQLVAGALERRAETASPCLRISGRPVRPADRPTTKSGRSGGRTAATALRAAASSAGTAPGRSRSAASRRVSAIVMLRESSIRTPRKFCWGTAARRISDGRNRQNIRRAIVPRRSRPRTSRSLAVPSPAIPRYVTSTAAAARPITAMVTTIERDCEKANSACSKRRGGYLKKKRTSASITSAF